MKYDLNQTVYYIEDNEIHSAPILSRMLVENLSGNLHPTHIYRQFDVDDCCKYSTTHGVYNEDDIFPSKRDLVNHLLSEDE